MVPLDNSSAEVRPRGVLSMRQLPRRRQADQRFGFWWAAQHILHDAVAAMWNFVDNRAVIRRIAFMWILWMTSVVIFWAMEFADNHPDMDGLKMAAILGAVLTPWSAMQAAVFKFYADSAGSNPPGMVTTMDSSTQTTTRKETL